MTLVTPSLVFCLVSIAYISILIRQTYHLTSTTLLVIRVLHLMTQVCSIAHTFLCRWYVLLERTPSSLRLALRPVTGSLLIHSQKVSTRVLDASRLTLTVTTEEFKSRTSCDPKDSQFFTKTSERRSFFI